MIPPRLRPGKKLIKIVLIVLAVIYTPYLLFLAYVAIQGNFHAITPGKAYRSGQLRGPALASHIEEYGIKSIINLRGADDKARWYKEEMRVSNQYNVRHYDVELSSLRAPSKDDLLELEEILRNAPQPVLIHCRVGADRTGVASAMWKVLAEGASKDEARKQLSIIYGHLPVGARFNLDRFFDNWSPTEPLIANSPQ